MGRPVQIEKKDSWRVFDQIAPTYDFLNRLVSLGVDGWWRKKMIRKVNPSPQKIKALDLATGTADVSLLLAHLDGVGHVHGIDLSREMILRGQKKVKRCGLDQKISLSLGDGVSPPFSDSIFDLVTVAFGVRNFGDVSTSLEGVRRVLRPGGQILVMEFGLPKNVVFKKIYLFYFRRILPWVGKIVSRHPFAYSYLNRTVESFPYGDQFTALLKQAKFREIRSYPLFFGVAYIYSGIK